MSTVVMEVFIVAETGSRALCEEYQRSYNLDYTILRYGSLYGPRSDYRNGLFRIVKNALETGNISYEGSPEAIREYIHVEDAARADVDAIKDEFCNQHVILSASTFAGFWIYLKFYQRS